MKYRTPTTTRILLWHDLTPDEQDGLPHDNSEYIRYNGRIIPLSDFSTFGCPADWDGLSVQSRTHAVVIKLLDRDDAVRVTDAYAA
jgi:hypothetical protein